MLASFVLVFSDATKSRTLLVLFANTRQKRLSCVHPRDRAIERFLTFLSFVRYTTTETKGLLALCLACAHVTCLLAAELSRWKDEELDRWMGEMLRCLT